MTVLKNFSLSVPAKKTVALVGASGSGKSSAIGLLERFYDNYSGEITLDGQDIKTLRPKSLRSMIGLVTQEPVLFNSTVFDNVALGLLNTELEHVSEAYKRELVQEACIAAKCVDFFSVQASNELSLGAIVLTILSCRLTKGTTRASLNAGPHSLVVNGSA